MIYGTLSVSDLLATTQQSVAAVGEERVWQAIDDALRVHNQITQELLGSLVETSTDRQRRYGGPDAMVMDEIDEYGTPDAQKVAAGQTVGFPLRLYGISVQWTRKYFQNHTPAELAAQFTAAQDADVKAIQRELKRAIFRPTNTTFVDRLVDNVSLGVKAFVNADSAPVPLGPMGDEFNGATHTHYLGTGSFVAADLTALIDTVVEHHNVGTPLVYINKAQEAAVRGFSGFTAYLDARLLPASTAQTARGSLDMMNPQNRAIGVYGAAEIWVKPWVPASYLFAWVMGGPRPLVMRQRPGGTGMVVAAEDEAHPLRARTLEREFGIGVWQRTNGAALYTGNATYAAPTIN